MSGPKSPLQATTDSALPVAVHNSIWQCSSHQAPQVVRLEVLSRTPEFLSRTRAFLLSHRCIVSISQPQRRTVRFVIRRLPFRGRGRPRQRVAAPRRTLFS